MSRTDRAMLLVHVDRAEVFEAISRSDALVHWLPPQGMHGRFLQFDMRAGGFYQLELTYNDPSGAPGKSSAGSDVVNVRIAQFVPGEQIVQEVEFDAADPAFQGTMEMEWRLSDTDGGTLVEVIARNVPPGIRAVDHAAGITSSLVNLATYLES